MFFQYGRLCFMRLGEALYVKNGTSNFSIINSNQLAILIPKNLWPKEHGNRWWGSADFTLINRSNGLSYLTTTQIGVHSDGNIYFLFYYRNAVDSYTPLLTTSFTNMSLSGSTFWFSKLDPK